MLIPACVSTAIGKGLLTPAKPIANWSAEPRVVLLCEAIREAIENGSASADDKERQCWAKVEAAFSHFIEGGMVHDNLVKQLVPAKFEHWEFKCRKPKPSIRVFGRFIMPDVFVATHPMERNLLGGMYSAAFEHEKLICEDHWKKAELDPPFSDVPGFEYGSYITANARRKLRIV
jgi:hypothetical protein